MILDVEHFVSETVFLQYMIFDLDEFVSETGVFAVYVFFANVFFLLYLFFW
jgi:hypothetical protein